MSSLPLWVSESSWTCKEREEGLDEEEECRNESAEEEIDVSKSQTLSTDD